MKLTKDKVSVVTTCYNGLAFLESYFSIVLSQSFDLIEWIIVDDCSTDESALKIEALINFYNLSSKVTLFVLPLNSGPVLARNFGISKSTGSYVCFLDIDDIWLPNKITHQLSIMHQFDCAISCTGYRHVSFDGSKIGSCIIPENFIELADILGARFIGLSTIMINTRKLHDFRFPSTNLLSEDFVAWLSILDRKFIFKGIDADLVRYRVSRNSRSSNKLKAAWHMLLIYKDIPNISLIRAVFFYTKYVIFSIKKYLIYMPNMDRFLIDGPQSSIGFLKNYE